MLKRFTWIAALLAAFAMVFIGCPTDAARDWEEPKEQFEENVLQVRPKQSWAGIDFNNAAFEFKAGDVVQVTGKALAANTVHISRNHQAWAPIWEKKLNPDEDFDSGKVTLTAADVSSIAGLNPPAMRLYGNTANGTFVIINFTLTRDGKEIYNLSQYLQTLKIGEKDIDVIFAEVGEEGNKKKWMSEASGGGSAADFEILGPGAGAEAEKVFTYKGATGKVVYTKDADTEVETVVDSDPSVTANGVDIIEANEKAGIVSMKVGSSLHYKFPTSATGAPVLDIEADWDYIEIEYTVSNVDKTSGGAGNFKARFFQYDSTTAYGYGSDPADMDGSGYANLGAAGAGKIYKIQTWGAGGKGGFTIGYNQYDVASSGADSLDIKITKVTFTKGTRYTVKFLTPQTPNLNNYADLKVLNGNTLGSRLPAPKNPGWAFKGWFEEWNETDQQGEGDQVTSGTTITANKKLYAQWLGRQPDEITITPTDANDALPPGVSRGNGPEFTDADGKKWAVMVPNNYISGQQYGTEIRYAFPWDQDVSALDTVKITVVARHLTDAEATAGGYTVTNPDGAMGATTKFRTAEYGYASSPDAGYPEWTAAQNNTAKVLTYKVADFNKATTGNEQWNGFVIIFNSYQWEDGERASPFLMRVTKIEFLYD